MGRGERWEEASSESFKSSQVLDAASPPQSSAEQIGPECNYLNLLC